MPGIPSFAAPSFAAPAALLARSSRSAQRHACPSRRRATPVATATGGGGPPAGVLLGASSVLAIATVGCVFELSSGHPQYGVPATAAILVGSGPGFVALFAAAIRKGQLEAEED